MPDTLEITSDYSGSLSPTSSEEEEEPEEQTKIIENSALLWTGSGARKIPLIMFRPESLISRDKKLKAIGEKYRLAYKMVKTESKLVRSVLGAYGFHEVHPNSAEFNLMWTGAHLKPFSLRSLQDFQKVNHFPRSYEITRKDRLYKNIERMAHTKGTKHFDFIPKSFLMPSEYQDFCAAYVKEKGSWIVKPIASSRGRGIYLINNPNQVPLEDNIMVCKYISNPLLIDGFKFDVRVYVAITSYDPLLIYLFEEGLTRFATVKYEKANKHLKNNMMHLTNYSINKKSHDYVRCEDPEVEDYGNKWSMSAMLRYLKQEGVDTAALMARIEAVIIKSIIAAELPIATACKMFVPHKENCIELYGFDILIDENLKPWILEGNLSPSLACDAPLDLKIKSSMISDFFSIAGFRCVDPMTRRQNKKQNDLLQRPYSAQRSSSAAANRGNKRPSSAGYKDSLTIAGRQGLTTEESRVLTMAKEQYQRRGSFVRIFPTVETWELYGSFLEYKSNLNYLLAQKLFPERAKSIHGTYSTAVARIRSMTSSQMLESRHHLISERLLQYERKLYTLESHRRRRTPSAVSKKQKNTDTPVGIDRKARRRVLRKQVESSSEESSDEEEDEEEQEEKKEISSSQSSKTTSLAQPSFSSGDVASSSKATKTSSHSELPEAATKSRPSSKTKLDQPGENSSTSARKSTPTNKLGDAKHPKTPTSAKSVPVQRVYMYKSSTPSDSGSAVKLHAAHSDGDRKGLTSAGSAHSSTLAYELGKKSESNQKSLSSTKNPKYVNVLSILKAGGNLGKLQARQAFSAYLSRVQHRLRMESEGHVVESSEAVHKQEEQMDLVLRFLKRAAGNLCQSFSVVVPSRRLSIVDRKRILSKQLGEFVRIYNKESDAMEQKHHLGLDKEVLPNSDGARSGNAASITDVDFRTFVSSASESSLEEVLTAYTHKNKSASVFLGASKAKSSGTSSSGVASNPTGGMYNASVSPHRNGNTHFVQYGEEIKAEKTSMTSLQQAAYIYSSKPGYQPSPVQKRPSSAKSLLSSGSYYAANQSSMRPVSASNRPFGSSIHYQSAANQEAISDALQRLTERQAARQYSASIQLTALSKHLSNLNLATMNGGSQHRLGSTDIPHANSPQRTSSLCNLANVDPSVQSMVDPSGMQKLNHGNSSDFLPQDGVDHSALHGSTDSIYKSQQALSQQSSTLLQQSKAKHQAMLAQMLDMWRARQQEVMRIGQYASNSMLLFPYSNGKNSRQNLAYHYQPMLSSRYTHYESLIDRNPKYSRNYQPTEDIRIDDAVLLQRTEKLINSSSRENHNFSPQSDFMAQMLKSSSTFLAPIDEATIRDPLKSDLKKAKASNGRSRRSSIYKSKKAAASSLSFYYPQQNSSVVSSSASSLSTHFRTPKLMRNDCGQSLMTEISSLFEAGELPTKRWKEKFKNARKIR